MANAPPPASTIRRSSVPLASRDSGGQNLQRRALAQQLVLAEAGDRAERRVDLDDLAVAREREALAHRVEDRLRALGLGADVLDEAHHREADAGRDDEHQRGAAPRVGEVGPPWPSSSGAK